MGKRIWVIIKNGVPWIATLESTLFSDLFHSEYPVYAIQENITDKLTTFLARRKVTKLTFGMLSGFLQDRYQLGHTLEQLAEKYDQISVFFLNATFSATRYPAEVLKAYKRRWPNIRYVLYYVDQLKNGASEYANYLREQSVFDAVYSFDEPDSKQNGFIFWRTPYSAKPEFLSKRPYKDLYFVGRSGGRYEILHAISQAGITHEANMDMDVLLTRPDNVADFSQSSLTFRLRPNTDVMTYDMVLEKTLEARCILDVVRNNQAGLSLRAYEAVVYNRKLLTNNPSILTFPFYDPRYMRCFETVEDIDWDWVKEDIPVDYHYNGEFSPINLLRDAEKRFWGSDDGIGSVSQ